MTKVARLDKSQLPIGVVLAKIETAGSHSEARSCLGLIALNVGARALKPEISNSPRLVREVKRIYATRNVMRALPRSYGDISTFTLSPTLMRMKFLRILPEMWASTSWPFGRATRNIVPGKTWVTEPVSSIGSSFATRFADGIRRKLITRKDQINVFPATVRSQRIAGPHARTDDSLQLRNAGNSRGTWNLESGTWNSSLRLCFVRALIFTKAR